MFIYLNKTNRVCLVQIANCKWVVVTLQQYNITIYTLTTICFLCEKRTFPLLEIKKVPNED